MVRLAQSWTRKGGAGVRGRHKVATPSTKTPPFRAKQDICCTPATLLLRAPPIPMLRGSEGRVRLHPLIRFPRNNNFLTGAANRVSKRSRCYQSTSQPSRGLCDRRTVASPALYCQHSISRNHSRTSTRTNRRKIKYVSKSVIAAAALEHPLAYYHAPCL